MKKYLIYNTLIVGSYLVLLIVMFNNFSYEPITFKYVLIGSLLVIFLCFINLKKNHPKYFKKIY